MEDFSDRNPGYVPIKELRNLANRKLCTKWGKEFFRTDGINYPIQSCDKEMLILSLGRLWKEFDSTPEIKFCHEAHDEIVLIAPDEKAAFAQERLKAAMEAPEMREQFLGEVPLDADVLVGDTWATVH